MTKSMFRDTMVDMKWTDVTRAAGENAVVLLPIGVIEEHGPHLCLGTDIYTAVTQCRYTAKELASKGIRTVIAPPFYWGVCQATGGFPGSFLVREETVRALVIDILTSLAGFGFTEVFGISGHGDIGHTVALLAAFREGCETLGIRARLAFDESRLAPYGLQGDEPWLCTVRTSETGFGRQDVPDVHAGDIETATVHRYYPGLADIEIAQTLPPVSLGEDRIMTWLFGGHTAELSPNGYLGAPADFGTVDIEAMMHDVAARLAEAFLSHRTESQIS